MIAAAQFRRLDYERIRNKSWDAFEGRQCGPGIDIRSLGGIYCQRVRCLTYMHALRRDRATVCTKRRPEALLVTFSKRAGTAPQPTASGLGLTGAPAVVHLPKLLHA